MGNTEQIITQFFRSYEKLTQIFPQKKKSHYKKEKEKKT